MSAEKVQEECLPTRWLRRSTLSRFNWLVTELIVIIIGVLVALGIDAWYGGVVEARDERTYLQQLVSDLSNTEQQMRAADSVGVDYAAGNTALLAIYGSSVYPPMDSLRLWLEQTQRFNNPAPIIGTAEALIATGDLRLVRDPGLRIAVTRWLSRSRDHWLVPLYQLEELHRETFYDLMDFADPLELPLGRTATEDSLVVLARSDDSPYSLDAEAFFHQRKPYTLLAQLYKLKMSMADFRRGMRTDAEELRLQIESFIDEE